MTYEEVQPGQRVVITTPHFNTRAEGRVHAKALRVMARKAVETVWVDVDRGSRAGERRIVSPTVLTLEETS